MRILSFTYWTGSHDNSACIVEDGRIVAAAEEERFSRKKHDPGFPRQAIEFCLKEAGCGLGELDRIALPVKPFHTGRNSAFADWDFDAYHQLRRQGLASRNTRLHRAIARPLLKMGLEFDLGAQLEFTRSLQYLRQHGAIPPIHFFDHHLCHAAAAYFTSGYDRAAIVTMDADGGYYSTAQWHARGNSIERIGAQLYNNSVGWFYLHCTRKLGLGDFSEGKTMGLAPYGDRARFRREFNQILSTRPDGEYRYRPELLEQFAARNGEPITSAPWPDLAAGCQEALERAVENVVTDTLTRTASRNLCLGGGVMLNCSSNGALLSKSITDEISIFPASSDAGLSVGAALVCAAEAGDEVRHRIQHVYFGPEFSQAQCEQALAAESRVSYGIENNLAENVAREIARGKVVGWFQGRMEMGPRALCHRSILADPRSISLRDRVNGIKGRETWRPLAPTVIAERAGEFFAMHGESPFMLFAVPVKPEKQQKIAGVVHMDGSARPQTVRREQNPMLYDVLMNFERHAGVPLLLNTSFNDASEPIVCSPADALRTFLATGLDLLVMNNLIVRKNGAAQ
jgi:carbamoyltransferase